MGNYSEKPPPVIVRGEGARIYDDRGRSYLDVELCRTHGIEVTFHQYVHPVYAQLQTPFVSHLSALDLLLSCGEDEARRVLASVP